MDELGCHVPRKSVIPQLFGSFDRKTPRRALTRCINPKFRAAFIKDFNTHSFPWHQIGALLWQFSHMVDDCRVSVSFQHPRRAGITNPAFREVDFIETCVTGNKTSDERPVQPPRCSLLLGL